MGGISRRDLLKTTATGTAAYFAGVGRDSVSKLIPYVIPPEHIEPGEWVVYATTCRECPAGCGMAMRCRDGRAIKAEGSRPHPVNLGGLCPRGQSAVQGLYDPDRISKPYETKEQLYCNWHCAPTTIGGLLSSIKGKVFLISGLQTGSLMQLMRDFLARFDSAENLIIYEPFDYTYIKNTYATLYGKSIVPYHDLTDCDYILSICCDYLETWVSNVQFARQLGELKSPASPSFVKTTYLGPRYSMTAASADEFLNIPAGFELEVSVAILASMTQQNLVRQGKEIIEAFLNNHPSPTLPPHVTVEQIATIARRLAMSKKSVTLAGAAGAQGRRADELYMAATLINLAAGCIGQSLNTTKPYALSSIASRQQFESMLAQITKDDIVIINNTNCVYWMPESAKMLKNAKTLVYAGTLMDETATIADYVLPMSHPLESWGDYQPYAGMHSIVQPVMQPVNDTKSFGDILITLGRFSKRPIQQTEAEVKDYFQYLQNYWRQHHRTNNLPGSFDEFWQGFLRQGFVQESPQQQPDMQISPLSKDYRLTTLNTAKYPLQLWAWGSIMLYDGRTANRGWIQENPEPMSSIVWGNCAEINPNLATQFNLANNDLIEIKSHGVSITCPVRITADVADNAVAVSLGQGHTAMGENAKGRGANVFALCGSTHAASMFPKITITKLPATFQPIYLQSTDQQFGREIIEWVSLSKLRGMKPGDGKKLILPLPEGYSAEHDLYPPHKHRNHRWAMVIDINRCIGCNACAVACYAENNVAVMGAGPLRRGREMAWLKVVPYRNEQDQTVAFLPILCQHCDAAPCEPVCPVFASVHNEEGLNAQVYNRCIGTRYCSNNCPYKVRRFNWFNVNWQKPLTMQLNPEVTVRSRGVMEKCTFCIQRIRAAEKLAKLENRPVRDGEVQPACVQSCPTGVFTFGDLMDPNSKVSQMTRQDPRRYHVLEELNTKPAVTYLQRIKNDIA